MPHANFVNPSTLAPTRGYTHIVEVTGGRIAHISGQVALDGQGNLVGKGDIKAQTEQVLENLKLAIEAVGGTLQDLVKVTYFLVDITQIAAVREVRTRYFDEANPPASTAVGVTGLVMPDLLIEIEGVASIR
ncbi:MAG: RidA family protein [Dehalococcoidia bacterium]|nr:RidA family protein [Dehalococcoidia bacterium]